MIQKLKQTSEHKYEVLDYITTPNKNYYINTGVEVDSTNVIEMTCEITNDILGAPRFFSSGNPNNRSAWTSPQTWEMLFDDSNVRIKPLGQSGGHTSTNLYCSSFINKKLRYNINAIGVLNIYDENDDLYASYDASANANPSYSSLFPVLLFKRTSDSWEYFNEYSKIYSVKMWKSNNLVRDYVPVKRLSDNKYGLYDLINDQFYASDGTNQFTGVSKSTPEYIDETLDTVYVNDIIINGDHINRIYLNGEVYWGGEASSSPPTPPTPTHLLHGTTTLTGSGTFNIGINNSSYNSTKNVPVQYDNGEFWLDVLPSSIGTITSLIGMFWGLSHVTSIDEFNLDTSHCVNWRAAFGGASITTFGTFSPDLSSCIELHDAFFNFEGETLDLSRWHVTSSVRDISGLLHNSRNLKHIDVSNWQLQQLSPRDMWYNMNVNQIEDVTMNNVSEGTFATFKYALQNNYPTQTTAKIFRDGVTYVYNGSQWVIE